MSEYRPTIGLEIHAELKTKSKMFCSCKNFPDDDRPNIHICPVCMGHPGTLPVLNKEAIKHVLKFGLAIEGRIANFTEWDRKNYFYPDIPKGYQISQYKYPLVSGGHIGGVKITRVHLEEDTASSTHDTHKRSLINFNRAGVPLMELVTEPCIKSGQEAAQFSRDILILLRYLGIGGGNLEKGEMRIEANISVSKTEKFGTKTEVKNLNSFKAVERAINYEIDRQIQVLEKGEKVIQETRGWDENKNQTFSQRTKEDSHDYRYFPDPDIPKLYISEIFNLDDLRNDIGELPWEKKKRLMGYNLTDKEAEIIVYNIPLAQYFEEVLKHNKNIKLVTNYLISDYLGLVKDDLNKVKPTDFSELITMIENGTVSSRGAKEILKEMCETGEKPSIIATNKGLTQNSDYSALESMAKKIIENSPKVVSEYKAGKTAVFQYFIGQAMKESKGSVNPEIIKKIFQELLTR